MEMETFWQTIESHSRTLLGWNDESAVPPQVESACTLLCDQLRAPHALAHMANPANQPRIQSIRNSCAACWSLVNSRLEFTVAETLSARAPTYADFEAELTRHWLTREAPHLIAAELELYRAAGLALTGARVCMVGPGAIPYTALALAAQGAHVTLVDMYAPACHWGHIWLNRYFPGQGRAVQAMGQAHDYTGYDLVVVASMLLGRAQVLARVGATRPRHLLVRTTSGPRPMGMVMAQVPPEELSLLQGATLVGESLPPLQVGNTGLLYHYA